jgi:hypothetical protein
MLPIHPSTYMNAWRNRSQAKAAEEAVAKVAEQNS